MSNWLLEDEGVFVFEERNRVLLFQNDYFLRRQGGIEVALNHE